MGAVEDSSRPTVVCLCGSTKFKRHFEYLRAAMTLKGLIVLGPDVFVHDNTTGLEVKDEDKERLDELHLRKIDMADVVFVVNPGNYIGESTRKEIAYATSVGKDSVYHEVWYEPAYFGDETFWQSTNWPVPDEKLSVSCNHEDMNCPKGECDDLYNREDMGR